MSTRYGASYVQGSGASGNTASLAWTEADDTAALTGEVIVIGALGWSEANDGCAITGNVGSGQTGALAWAEADDVAAISATATAYASLAWTEDADVSSITASVLISASGVLAWVEQDDAFYLQAATTAQGGHGFEMVSMEPSWKRALRLRAESKQKVELGRKQRKRAEFIEKLAAKEALSSKPDSQIETRIESLLSEWVDLAPKLELKPVAELPHADAYSAFMARVAEHVRRLEEDDETAAEMLLLM